MRNDLLTVAQAAELAGTTEKAIRRRIERGVLPKTSGNDGRVRVPAAALGIEAPASASAQASAQARGSDSAASDEGAKAEPLPAAELLDRIERLSRELGAAEAQLQRRRWWRP